MKVVINECFGGFSLSPAATRRLAELQGKPCYFFSPGLNDFDQYMPVDEPDNLVFFVFSVPNPNDLLAKSKPWHRMSDAEKQAHNAAYRAARIDNCEQDRANPLLVQVVEEMGSLTASGSCAKLKVVEVPDDIEWTIQEYDGNEHVAEVHRTWQ